MRRSVLLGRIRTILRQLWRIVIRADKVCLHDVVLRTRHLPRQVRMAIYAEDYENEEVDIVSAAVTPGDTVLELGTGIGFICAKTALLGADPIYTFEPNPALQEQALETFRLNGVSPHLTSAILGKEKGTVDFYVHDEFTYSSTLRKESGVMTQVPVAPFNDFVRKIKPNTLICDIEGGERELLKFADLSSFQKVVMELHPDVIGNDDTVEVVDRLREQGFKPNYELSRNKVFLFER